MLKMSKLPLKHHQACGVFRIAHSRGTAPCQIQHSREPEGEKLSPRLFEAIVQPLLAFEHHSFL